MERWLCTSCGYIYDPAEGDDMGGVPPGTSFSELPDDWVCPDCGADKSAFEMLPPAKAQASGAEKAAVG